MTFYGPIGANTSLSNLVSVAINTDLFTNNDTGVVIGHTAQIDFGAIPEFQVLGTATPDSSMGFARFENNASGPDVRFLKSRGATIGANTIVNDGDTLGRFRFQGADGGDFNTTAAEVLAKVDGTPALNDIPGKIVFRTRTAAGSLSDKVTIDNVGLVTLVDGIIAGSTIRSDTDSTDDLGSSSIFWANSYIDRVHLNSTADINGSNAGILLTTGDIIPSVDNTDDFGSTLFAFKTIFARNIDDRDGVGAINFLADINLGGRNIDDAGVIFLKEQAEADADVVDSGQVWVDTVTPNRLFFTDDAGTDIPLGNKLYEAVVDAAGGADYTTIEAAFADSKTVVFVRNGTYNPSSDIDIPNKGKLTGESRGGVIIDFQSVAGRNITAATGNDDITIENLTIQNSQAGVTTGAVHFVNTDNSVVRNCYFAGGSDGSIRFDNGMRNLVSGCFFDVDAGNNDNFLIHIASKFTTVTGCTLENINVVGITIKQRDCVVSGNTLEGVTSRVGISIETSGLNAVVSGNLIRNWLRGVDIAESDATVVGNRINSNPGSTAGIRITNAGDNSLVASNNITITDFGIDILSGADDCTIVGNMGGSFDNQFIRDAGARNYIFGNGGIDEGERAIDERKIMWMKNTSGGQLVLGDLVTYKAVAAGDEYTTTTTQGDNLVYGMVLETTADAAFGKVQTIGKTTALKVNGTIDIAVGDYIGTFTTATIGQKAAVGDMAIAIALEAYTTDDSSGVIDALLITPRKIAPSTSIVAKTGAYTATINDHVITCDASGGAFTITLPAASGLERIIYHIKKTDSSANAVTVDGNASETIDGSTTAVIAAQFESIMIVCDNSNWHII